MFEPHVFITDASPEETKRYTVGSKYDWDREDWIGHFADKEKVESNQSDEM